MHLEASVRAFSTQLSLPCSIALTLQRDMTHLRDEAAQSSAVDANALMDKLK